MQAKDIKEILIDAEVSKLYHVNTVVTSLSFLKNGGLLSRQEAEIRGALQTGQESDNLDKKYDIYNDIFFDSVDIHERARRPNDYGVVMFVYSVDMLDLLEKYDICITKDNPIRWNGTMRYEDKYFTNKRDLRSYFQKGNFFQHITVREINEPLSFDYLEKIVIENPGDGYQELLINAIGAIEKELNYLGADIPVFIRECQQTCGCMEKYRKYKPGYAYHRFKTTI